MSNNIESAAVRNQQSNAIVEIPPPSKPVNAPTTLVATTTLHPQAPAQATVLKKAFHVVEERGKEGEKITKAVRKGATIYFAFKKVPQNISTIFQAMKFAGALPALFDIIECGDKVIVAISGKKGSKSVSTFERVRAAFEAIMVAKGLVCVAIEIAQALEAVGAFAKGAAHWAVPLQSMLLPFEVIRLTLATIDLWNTKRTWDELAATDVHNESIALTALKLLEEKEKTIKKEAMLGEDVSIKETTDKLKVNLNSKIPEKRDQAVEDTKKLMDELKGRVKKKIAFSIVDIVLKIGIIVFGALLVFSPGAPLFLGILAGISLISIGIFFYKKYGMTKTIPSLVVKAPIVSVPSPVVSMPAPEMRGVA